MTTNYHTPYQDNVTTFRAADMNPPLGALDAAITELAATSGGDVDGPAANTDSYVPQWNGANSKTLKDGLAVVTSVGSPGADTSLPTEKAVATALAGKAPVSQPYIIGGFFPGLLTASQVLVAVPFSIDTVFPPGLSISKLVATIPATAQAVFSLRKNGVQFGTATFSVGGTVAVFASATGATFTQASTDIFSLIAPATPDATLAGVGWSVAGTR